MPQVNFVMPVMPEKQRLVSFHYKSCDCEQQACKSYVYEHLPGYSILQHTQVVIVINENNRSPLRWLYLFPLRSHPSFLNSTSVIIQKKQCVGVCFSFCDGRIFPKSNIYQKAAHTETPLWGCSHDAFISSCIREINRSSKTAEAVKNSLVSAGLKVAQSRLNSALLIFFPTCCS